MFHVDSLKFQHVNKAAQHNLGYSIEELTPLDLKPEFTLEAFNELIKPLRDKSKGKLVFETIHHRKDKSTYDVEVHLQLLEYDGLALFTAIILDITDRKDKERELLILNRAVDSLNSGILITDPRRPDNPIIYCNQTIIDLTGYSKNEFIGKNCRFLQKDDNTQDSIEEIRAAIREQRDCNVELRNYRKDGSMFWAELKIAPVFNNKGELTHFISNQTDITRRKEAELRLVNRTTELIYNQIEDDGIGISQESLNNTDEHVGITGMQELCAAIGGKLEIKNPKDGGTRIKAVIPLN